MRVVLAAIVVAVLLAGCSGSKSAPRDGDAETQARDALAAFASDFEDGGDLREMTGSFAVAPDAPGGASTASLTLEWGTQDSRRIALEMGDGGFSFKVEIICTEDGEAMVFGADVYERRPARDAAHGCSEQDDVGETMPLDQIEDLRATKAQSNSDGSVEATFKNETGTFTVKTDTQGRLVEMGIDDGDGKGSFHFDYGKRKDIDLPAATARMPADIFVDEEFDEGSYTAMVDDAPQQPDVDDFEVRVLDAGTVVATFPLGRDGESGGYRFDFTDADGGDRVSARDHWTISKEGWTPFPGDVVLYDSWAGANVGDNPIPGLPVAWLAVALVAAAIAVRRR